MNDLQMNDNRLQIFCTFIVGFGTLRETVKEMALSKDPSEQKRAEEICDIIVEMMVGTKSIYELTNKLKVDTESPKVSALVDFVKNQLSKEEDDFLLQLNEQMDYLKREITMNLQTHKRTIIEGLDDIDVITSDSSVPITSDDLHFLNELAAVSIKEGEFLSDYSKYFNTLAYKSKINKLYHMNPYYFEQAFSNIDVRLQSVILEMVNNDLKYDRGNSAKNEAIQSLEDLYVLSTIDTSANKMSSKVSDHQAFEMFLTILEKNNNSNIIKKILKDDIIMKTLLEVSTSTSGNNYGFRRLFTSAKHPYDELIMKKFKQVKHYNEQNMKIIVSDLCRDSNFKNSYDIYNKAEKTKSFKIIISATLEAMATTEINAELIQSVVHVIREFNNLEDYSEYILPITDVYDVMKEVYKHVIASDLFDEFPNLTEAIESFYSYRVHHDHNERRSRFKVTEKIAIYGITPEDIWFDFHKIIHEYNITDYTHVYLKYGSMKSFEFEVKGMMTIYGKQLTTTDMKNMPSNHMSLICADVDVKGFDVYIYGVYNRLFKALLKDNLVIAISRIEGGKFKKVEYAGLVASDDANIRRAVSDFFILSTLVKKDPDLFMTLYWRKVGNLLDSIVNTRASYEKILKHTKIGFGIEVLNIFKHKSSAMRLYNEHSRIINKAKKVQIDLHMQEFLALTDEVTDVIK